MEKRKFVSRAVNVVYLIMVVLFVSDELTTFEIKNEGIKLFVFYGILFSSAPLLIWNYLAFKSRFIATALPVLMLLMIFVVGPTKILFSSNVWKTQIILYENKQSNTVKIEYQTKDMGALGINNRSVKVIYLTDLFMFVDTVPTNIESKTEWVKVNIQTNALGFKYP